MITAADLMGSYLPCVFSAGGRCRGHSSGGGLFSEDPRLSLQTVNKHPLRSTVTSEFTPAEFLQFNENDSDEGFTPMLKKKHPSCNQNKPFWHVGGLFFGTKLQQACGRTLVAVTTATDRTRLVWN